MFLEFRYGKDVASVDVEQITIIEKYEKETVIYLGDSDHYCKTEMPYEQVLQRIKKQFLEFKTGRDVTAIAVDKITMIERYEIDTAIYFGSKDHKFVTDMPYEQVMIRVNQAVADGQKYWTGKDSDPAWSGNDNDPAWGIDA